MLSAETLVSFEAILATFLFLYIGILTPSLLAGTSAQRLLVLMAVAAGILFWSFVDLMNDAALLGVNQGFTGGLSHGLLAASFGLALLVFFWFERKFSRRRGGTRLTGLTYGMALLLAAGIGFHSMGEGLEIGSLIGYASLAGAGSIDLITAIGGLGSGAAYLLHKLLEGFVIGVFLSATRVRSTRIAALGLVAGVPTMLGVGLALVTPVDATIFFAVGAAVVIYAEYKLLPNLAAKGNVMVYALAILLGFYLMYLAGLFHSYTTIF